MEPVLEHFREYYKLYAGIALVGLPPILIFRRFTIPAILYVVEFVIYAVLMHCLLGGVIRLAAWFKAESAMKRAFDARANTNPGWITPFRYFYDRALYNPPWLFYLEIALLVAILAAMWKYRPLRAQKKRIKPLTARSLSKKMAQSQKKRPSFGRK